MDIKIIGAGPSGLMAGIVCARKNHKVVIIERNDRPGKKLLATGNGRCNYSNENISIDRYHGENPKFAYSALSRLGYGEIRDFFSSLGMDTRVLSKSRAYPRSLQSSSVLDLLLMEFHNLGGQIIYNEKVESIDKADSFTIKTSKSSYKADKLILACGGMTLKNSGSDGSGYDLARMVGHRITDLSPAIVQIDLKGESHKQMSGTRFDGRLSLYEGDKFIYADEDEILFTDYGISGPAVLQLSRSALDIINKDKKAYFSIDLFPEYKEEDLRDKLAYDFAISKNKLGQSLVGKINDNLIGGVLAGFDTNRKASSLSYQELGQISKALKDWRFEIKGYKSMDSGQVTAGGVDTRGINPSTMESKICQGLYFVGEILDIDGDCGGFNLHWAWASANLAGSSI